MIRKIDNEEVFNSYINSLDRSLRKANNRFRILGREIYKALNLNHLEEWVLRNKWRQPLIKILLWTILMIFTYLGFIEKLLNN